MNDYPIFDEWPLVLDRESAEVRRDPLETEGYGLRLKENDNILLFPRGCLKDLIINPRRWGERVMNLNHLIPSVLKGNFFKGTSLGYNETILILGQAYAVEEMRREKENQDMQKDII